MRWQLRRRLRAGRAIAVLVTASGCRAGDRGRLSCWHINRCADVTCLLPGFLGV
jgi:lipoprotein